MSPDRSRGEAPSRAEAGVTHAMMANAIRVLAMDAVEQAASGHPGAPMGLADVATVLFTRHLKFDPSVPDWPDRDRFVLSNGHASMLLYGVLHLTGYADMTMEEIKRFRQRASRTPGHPEHGAAAGVETTTGPLGQGFANAVGMALAERILAARFGADLVDHHTYVIAGDGCLMEGLSHEAISLAGHLRLGRLIVLFDDNAISIDGPTDLAVSDDQLMRFRASGWDAARVDGHDAAAIDAAITRAKAVVDRPSLIACRTVIGYGAKEKRGTAAAHGAPLGKTEIAAAREALAWPHPPFVIPEAITQAWREAGGAGAPARKAWETRLAATPAPARNEFERVQRGTLPAGVSERLASLRATAANEAPALATRRASQQIVDVLAEVMPEILGGSADLTGSNNTRPKSAKIVRPGHYDGQYLHYGVREHAMAAAMSGIVLHGGLRPYGGTFLTFSDYCRPAIRLAALMRLGVIYVMSHDSIGLGEDGPTHQPVEHLASLRAIPNLNVFRPADMVETAECWEIALASTHTPSVIALSRQGAPTLRTTGAGEILSAKGAYVLAEADGPRDATILATGTELSLAMEARETLAGDGIHAAVVSMPCWALFEAQPPAYRKSVLGSAPRVAVEAGVAFGWSRYLGGEAHFIGMRGFGASAPYKELYAHFGITREAVADAVRQCVARQPD